MHIVLIAGFLVLALWSGQATASEVISVGGTVTSASGAPVTTSALLIEPDNRDARESGEDHSSDHGGRDSRDDHGESKGEGDNY